MDYEFVTVMSWLRNAGTVPSLILSIRLFDRPSVLQNQATRFKFALAAAADTQEDEDDKRHPLAAFYHP